MHKGIVVWDLNGTLVDDLHVSHAVACAIIKAYGNDRGEFPSRQEFRGWMRGDFLRMYHVYGVPSHMTLQDMDAVRCHHYKKHPRRPMVREFAHEAVEGLHRARVVQAIVSADGQRTFDFVMSEVMHRFRRVIPTGYYFGASWPKDDRVREIALRHSVPLSRVVYVGDTASDIEMAHRIGALSIGLMHETSYGLEEHILEAKPHVVVTCLRHIPIEAKKLLFG